ncbi:hypothetical protein CRG98_020331 [Punica granatum]|uniref:Uncharacterized protein n=1 Tax=Punica granatum TaxID=22663 RepID=A0A2I0JSL6_PUNGR|nr:hypothetical protein CRG98_020331 [Punica granatum]
MNWVKDLMEAGLEYAESVLGKKRRTKVETWLTHAQRVQDEVHNAEREVAEARILSRMQLVNRVDEQMKEVEQLLERSAFSKGLVIEVVETGEIELLTQVSAFVEWEEWHGASLKGRMFEKNLDCRVPLPCDVEKIAKSVANECGGLPLGITILSRTMRGIEDIHEWKNALGELREPKFDPECMEMRFSDR